MQLAAVSGADLPLLLIFAGVLGNLLSFGLLGFLIAPLVAAVTYTLLEAWVKDERPEGGGGPNADGLWRSCRFTTERRAPSP
jgi:predicted PurR-regulated permease PerM